MKNEGVPAKNFDLMAASHNLEMLSSPELDDKPQDECGVFAIYAPGEAVGQLAYDTLQQLQHRGQSGAGVAYCYETGKLMAHKGKGLVDKAVPEIVPYADRQNPIDMSNSILAIGHTRYSTAESDNAFQPFLKSDFALAHNGHLELIGETAWLYDIDPAKASSDSDMLTMILAKRATELDDFDKALDEVLPLLEGAYTLTITDGRRVIGVRDPWGTHPLALGRLPGGGFIMASETIAFADGAAEFVRDIEQGEIITIDETGVDSRYIERDEPQQNCMFEYIYIADPDSIVNGVSVYKARKNMGKYLALDHPVDADIVVGVPETGSSAASGFAEESGIKLVSGGLRKNGYLGRTFIMREGERDEMLRRKFKPNSSELTGQRVVLIEDSIIKGHTMRALVGRVRAAGAREVHVRSAAPRYVNACYGGMDTRQVWRLIARGKTNEDIADEIGADSVAFNAVERVEQAVQDARSESSELRNLGSLLCTACVTGEYPYRIPNPNQTISVARVAISAPH